MTINNIMDDTTDYVLIGGADNDVLVHEATVWPIGSPWVTAEDVLKSPRVFNTSSRF